MLEQPRKHADKGHGRGHGLAFGLQRKATVAADRRRAEGIGLAATCRQVAAQRLAPRMQVLQLGAVLARMVKRQGLGLRIRQRQIEAVAKRQNRVAIQLFLLMRGHLALAGLPHPEAFLGLGQNHGGLARVGSRGRVGSVDLDEVVPASTQPVDLFVGQPLRQPLKRLVLAEEMLAVVSPVLGGKGLELTIHRVGKGLNQGLVGIAGKQPIPIRTPDQLDDAPAGSGEQGFQLVDDPPIAAHRAVQTLQIAVDHPDQIVEALTRRQR